MKNQITSVDLFYLAAELDATLSDSRIEKIYQIGSKELKIKFHSAGRGAGELVIAPAYVCVTSYKRETPETPSSFAMQMRKHLSGGFIRSVKQHAFDRILEFYMECKGERYVLFAEFFSRGNVIFCREDRTILGLLEWQRWKDRSLGVRKTYEYPPATNNPLEIAKDSFMEKMASSEKKTVVFLASEIGLGGLYAEETCLKAGLEKDKSAKELSGEEKEKLYAAFEALMGDIKERKTQAGIVYEEGTPSDVTPFALSVHEGLERKEFPSFNEAVDEFFSVPELSKAGREKEEKYEAELKKLAEIEDGQKNTLLEFERKIVESKETGDLIYQGYSEVEALLSAVREMHAKKTPWADIDLALKGSTHGPFEVESVGPDGTITLRRQKS